MPIERLNGFREEFAALRRAQVLCHVHFGDEAEKAIGVVFDARHKVHITAQMLLDMVGDTDLSPEEKETRRQFRRDVWSVGSGPDEIAMRVDKAYATIKELCLPHLK